MTVLTQKTTDDCFNEINLRIDKICGQNDMRFRNLCVCVCVCVCVYVCACVCVCVLFYVCLRCVFTVPVSQQFFSHVYLLGWQRIKCFPALWRFWLGDLSVYGMVGAWCFRCCRACCGLPVGFILLRYSALFTVESLSLLYFLFVSWFVCSGVWCVGGLGACRADQASVCLGLRLH